MATCPSVEAAMFAVSIDHTKQTAFALEGRHAVTSGQLPHAGKSLMSMLEHTSEIDLSEVRAMAGLTYRIR